MTAFTVGHTANYDAALVGPPPPVKVGRTDNLNGTGKPYAGGAVFVNAERAAWYINSIGKADIWSVYEIDADYVADAYQCDADEPFRRLLRDAVIIGKTGL